MSAKRWFAAAVIASIILAVAWIALWLDAFRDWDKGWGNPVVQPGESEGEQIASYWEMQRDLATREMAAYQCGDELPCPHCGDGACR